MGLSSTTAEEISVGAGDLFYRDTDVAAWTAAGATTDDNVWRHILTMFAPDINGVVSPIKGTDYTTEERAELEFSPLELSAALIKIAIPGSETATETEADATGAVGVLDAAIVPGQNLAIKISSVASLVVGDWIQVGTVAGSTENRQVTRVGTTGSGGTGIDVEYPFLLAHASGVAWLEINGGGGTNVTPSTQRRLPSSAYHDFRLDVPGLDGRVIRYFIYDGIVTSNAEFTASDDAAAAPRFTISSRIDASNVNRGGWAIRKEPQAVPA